MSLLFRNENENRGFDIPSMPVADLIKSLKKALMVKQGEMQEFGVSIRNVELTLKTVATVGTGASISLQIPLIGKMEFGSDISEKSVQTTKLTLKPTGYSQIRELELIDMERTVVQSISSIFDGVKEAVEGEVPLELEEASFEFNFVLSTDSKISMVIDSGFESELSNTIKINFKRE